MVALDNQVKANSSFTFEVNNFSHVINQVSHECYKILALCRIKGNSQARSSWILHNLLYTQIITGKYFEYDVKYFN